MSVIYFVGHTYVEADVIRRSIPEGETWIQTTVPYERYLVHSVRDALNDGEIPEKYEWVCLVYADLINWGDGVDSSIAHDTVKIGTGLLGETVLEMLKSESSQICDVIGKNVVRSGIERISPSIMLVRRKVLNAFVAELVRLIDTQDDTGAINYETTLNLFLNSKNWSGRVDALSDHAGFCKLDFVFPERALLVHPYGGLCNQLFQVLSGYAIAKENNMSLILTPTCRQSFSRTSSYRSSALRSFDRRGKLINAGFEWTVFHENGFRFGGIPRLDNERYVKLDGYFQSWKYFEKYIDELIPLVIDERYLREGAKLVNEAFPNVPFGNIVAVHVRRGDYLKLADYHCSVFADNLYWNLAIQYFIETLGSETRFLVMSDDQEWCRSKFKGSRFHILHHTVYRKELEINPFTFMHSELPQRDYTDFVIMSQLCQGGIVVSNSSFSALAAILGKQKHVVAPKNWFGQKALTEGFVADDIYQDHWKLL